MARTRGPHTATFIVRLWLEKGGKTERAWRGQVEHVQSSEKRYVREMAQVIEFIEERCAEQVLRIKESGIH
jgi:hypothetical protein